jgi:hypothetical protein
MPILNLKCSSCGKEFARIIFGESLGTCPVCKEDTLESLGETFDVSKLDVKRRYSTGCSDCECDGESCSC